MHITPACWVIKQFGGIRPLARSLRRSPGNVLDWRKGGTGTDVPGEIPARAMRQILEIAKEKNLDITPADLICGREVAEPVV